MRKEFGREFEIARTRHYVVCAPRGEKPKQYAAVFVGDLGNTFIATSPSVVLKFPSLSFP